MSGLQRVTDDHAVATRSRASRSSVSCPAGKSVLGTGFDISGATTGADPNLYKEATIDEVAIAPDLSSATFYAYEQKGGTAEVWSLCGTVTCATVA